jgi:hypothetical protein
MTGACAPYYLGGSATTRSPSPWRPKPHRHRATAATAMRARGQAPWESFWQSRSLLRVRSMMGMLHRDSLATSTIIRYCRWCPPDRRRQHAWPSRVEPPQCEPRLPIGARGPPEAPLPLLIAGHGPTDRPSGLPYSLSWEEEGGPRAGNWKKGKG